MSKIKKHILIFLALLGGCFLFAILPTQAQTVLDRTTLTQQYQLYPGEAESLGDFRTYIRNFYFFSIGAAMLVATILMMVGGVIWLTSAGNQGRIAKAKEFIINPLIGVILLIAAYVILQIINPKLVALDSADLPVIPGAGTCDYDWVESCHGTPELRNAKVGCFQVITEEECVITAPSASCPDKGRFTEKNQCETLCKRIGRDGSCYTTTQEVNDNRVNVITPNAGSLLRAVNRDLDAIGSTITSKLPFIGD